MTGRSLGLLHLVHQHEDGLPSEFHDALADAAQRRVGRAGSGEVVEADDRHVFGDASASLLQNTQRGRGHKVRGGENRVHIGVIQEQSLHGRVGPVGEEVADFLERGVQRESGGSQRVSIAALSVDGGGRVQVARYRGDLPATQGDEVVDCQRRPLAVVGVDVAGDDPPGRRAADNDRDTRFAQPVRQPVVAMQAGQNRPVDVVAGTDMLAPAPCRADVSGVSSTNRRDRSASVA